MKLIINIYKKHAYALLILVTIIASAGFVVAITATQAYHPLQDVAKSASDLTSVDSNSNGIIDAAELLLGTNMLPASGSAGIGTTSPAQKLHVIGKAQADDFCLNADTAKCLTTIGAATLDKTSSFKIFDIPGTYSWTVPSGVASIVTEVWGAGGGGGSGLCYGTGSEFDPVVCTAGGGGGGGGYAKWLFDVAPGDVLTITVGAGGLGIGGTSSVVKGGSTLIRATGGNNATNIGYAPINVSGWKGGSGTPTGASGGAGGNGGAGGRNSGNGIAPGGGGAGGGYSGSVGFAGGSGAPGRVIIWWES